MLNKHEPPRPSLLFWSAVSAALAILGWGANATLTSVDANMTDLPDPMISSVGFVAAAATVAAVALACAHVLRQTSNANTARVMGVLRELTHDTEPLPPVRRAVGTARVVVVPSLDVARFPDGVATQVFDLATRIAERRRDERN